MRCLAPIAKPLMRPMCNIIFGYLHLREDTLGTENMKHRFYRLCCGMSWEEKLSSLDLWCLENRRMRMKCTKKSLLELCRVDRGIMFPLGVVIRNRGLSQRGLATLDKWEEISLTGGY